MALTTDWCRICLAWGSLVRAERDDLCSDCLEDRNEATAAEGETAP